MRPRVRRRGLRRHARQLRGDGGHPGPTPEVGRRSMGRLFARRIRRRVQSRALRGGLARERQKWRTVSSDGHDRFRLAVGTTGRARARVRVPPPELLRARHAKLRHVRRDREINRRRVRRLRRRDSVRGETSVGAGHSRGTRRAQTRARRRARRASRRQTRRHGANTSRAPNEKRRRRQSRARQTTRRRTRRRGNLDRGGVRGFLCCFCVIVGGARRTSAAAGASRRGFHRRREGAAHARRVRRASRRRRGVHVSVHVSGRYESSSWIRTGVDLGA